MIARDRPLLLDTVAFILWHMDSPKLSAAARQIMLQAPARTLYVSAASAFEIATKVRLGKLEVPPAILSDFAYVVLADGFQLLDVNAEAAVMAGRLPGQHRDPFDRLLAAQARLHDAAVVTNDAAFSELGVDVLW